MTRHRAKVWNRIKVRVMVRVRVRATVWNRVRIRATMWDRITFKAKNKVLGRSRFVTRLHFDTYYLKIWFMFSYSFDFLENLLILWPIHNIFIMLLISVLSCMNTNPKQDEIRCQACCSDHSRPQYSSHILVNNKINVIHENMLCERLFH